jgi:hypothetical protein
VSKFSNNIKKKERQMLEIPNIPGVKKNELIEDFRKIQMEKRDGMDFQGCADMKNLLNKIIENKNDLRYALIRRQSIKAYTKFS